MIKKTLKKFKYMDYPVQTYKLGEKTYEFVVVNKSGYGNLKVVNIRSKDLISAKKKLKKWMTKDGHHKNGINRTSYL